MMPRRTLLQALAGLALLGLAPAVWAETYPAKPVTMIIPFPPGGTLDVVGRMLAQ